MAVTTWCKETLRLVKPAALVVAMCHTGTSCKMPTKNQVGPTQHVCIVKGTLLKLHCEVDKVCKTYYHWA